MTPEEFSEKLNEIQKRNVNRQLWKLKLQRKAVRSGCMIHYPPSLIRMTAV